MKLRRSFAVTVGDAEEFASFSCCPDDGPAWVREAENYVRVYALGHANWVLAFRDEADELVAVSAFDPRVIEIPLVAPVEHDGWHLQVVAIALPYQGQGLSAFVYSETFAAMREVSQQRELVTANVHSLHTASRRAAARAGLDTLVPIDDDYIRLLGVVPAAS